MELQECIKFANTYPVCFIATVDGDQPRVRTVMHVSADESGFYYALLSMKHVSRQLKATPKMEVCYYTNPPGLGEARQMRVAGVAELLNDPALIKKVPMIGLPGARFLGSPWSCQRNWRISHWRRALLDDG